MKDEDFKITRKEYRDDFQLLRKKGSIPYSFYSSHECFDETELSPIMFYDELKYEMLDERVYNSAKEIWDHYKIKNDKRLTGKPWNHGQVIDLYLKSDVLLLADCLERSRDVNMKHFKIDPCHCYSSPGLTCQVHKCKTRTAKRY
jgi:hypothetical protein